MVPLRNKTRGFCVPKSDGSNLQGLQPRCVVVYIDNIKVYIPKLKQHQLGLEDVFLCLEAALYCVCVSDALIVQKPILVLWYCVPAQGIELNSPKVTAILHLPKLRSNLNIKSFMGMIGFY